MKIFITGGTGLIGTLLTKTLLGRGDQVTLQTLNRIRDEQTFGFSVRYCDNLERLTSFDGFDAVINLAGASISPPWSEDKKKLIYDSRINTTKKIVQLILAGNKPPSVFISGSAVGYYGSCDDAILNENSHPNEDFLHSVCKEWEFQAMQAASACRVCLSRTGIVLSAKGGMLASLKPTFRMGLGAVMGSGKQYISWVHHQDIVGMLCLLLDSENAEGAFNMTAPNPVDNQTFSDAFSKALKRPRLFRIPSFMMKLFLGEGSVLILEGQRAVPNKIISLGYQFKFSDIVSAFQDVIRQTN